jgi:hypothetical protein
MSRVPTEAIRTTFAGERRPEVWRQAPDHGGVGSNGLWRVDGVSRRTGFRAGRRRPPEPCPPPCRVEPESAQASALEAPGDRNCDRFSGTAPAAVAFSRKRVHVVARNLIRGAW